MILAQATIPMTTGAYPEITTDFYVVNLPGSEVEVTKIIITKRSGMAYGASKVTVKVVRAGENDSDGQIFIYHADLPTDYTVVTYSDLGLLLGHGDSIRCVNNTDLGSTATIIGRLSV